MVETARREPLGISLTWLTNSKPRPGPDDPRQQVGQIQSRSFDARRHNAGGDHGGFEQAQIVAGEIKNLGQAADVRGGAQVHAGQAQNRFVNHPQAGLHRRLRRGVAPVNAEVNRDIEHARAFGKIHAEKENVAPAGVAQIHAHRGAFAQHGVGAVAAALQQFRARRAADDPPDGPCETSIGCRAPSARCAGPGRPASESRGADRPRPARWKWRRWGRGFFAPPRNWSSASSNRRCSRCSNPLNGIMPFRAGAAISPADENGGSRRGKTTRGRARKDCRCGGGRRPVPRRRRAVRAGGKRAQTASSGWLRMCGVRRGDDFDERAGHAREGCIVRTFRRSCASSSTSPASTSARAGPLKASASCAVSRPYFKPMSKRRPCNSQAR